MSEPVPSHQAGQRDLAGARRADRAAFVLALSVGAVVLVATLWLATIMIQPRLQRLEVASTEAAQTLASAVAEDFAEAVALGIPLPQMRGVDDYLSAVLRSDNLVSAVLVLGAEEQRLFAVPARTAVPRPLVRAQIMVDDKAVGTIIAGPSPQIAETARLHLLRSAIAMALLVGLLSGILFRIALLERLNLPQARLGAAAGAVGRGTFGEFTPPRAGAMLALGRSAGLLLAPIRREYRRLVALTDEVRALDTFGRVRTEIDDALAPLAAYSFDRPRKGRMLSSANALWWPFAALAALFTPRALVASFAADRVDTVHVPLAIGSAVGANALGAIVGLAVAFALGGRAPKLTPLFSLLIAAAAIGVTAIVRDPYIFTALQCAAGLFGAIAVGSTFCTEGAFARLPWRAGIVLIGAAAVGPTLGALLAEAAGRRISFATVGVLTAIIALTAAAGPPRRRAARRPRWGLPLSTALGLVSASFAVVTWIDISFSAGAMREDYAGLGYVAVVTGAAAFLPFALSGPPQRAFSVGGAALVVALFAAALFAEPALLSTLGVAAVVGLSFGLAVRGAGSRAFGFGGATCLAAGTLLAGALEAGKFLVPALGSTLALAIAVAALVGVIATVRRR
ncbi:hypothetical protein RDV64_00875 [Acuticoccus sp. MNP-M23]|uniref:hypothetical protein n=1 Tax=Acuticoccus sp. MNP-M23 TaxID=3072793 RepID=UPI0028165215|nr:hypothetical protein [Acuticoccus sp. MNP-M23]WMS42986.1 hypothetical protein RDV64_00875 [Acuticoccus sp. MNP-M23]